MCYFDPSFVCTLIRVVFVVVVVFTPRFPISANVAMAASSESRLDKQCTNAFLQHINNATAPPSYGSMSSGKKTSRLPWRTANSQWCNACGEGGELLCCERCPASFHLICLCVSAYISHCKALLHSDPPLDVERIPTGSWACARCMCVPELCDDMLPKSIANGDKPKPKNIEPLEQANRSPLKVLKRNVKLCLVICASGDKIRSCEQREPSGT